MPEGKYHPFPFGNDVHDVPQLCVTQQWFEFVLFGRAWPRWLRAGVLHPESHAPWPWKRTHSAHCVLKLSGEPEESVLVSGVHLNGVIY